MSLVVFPVLDTDAIRYSVQDGLGFMAEGYYKARRMVHCGTDYNDTRGGDSDLGAPVFCVADGVVEEARFFKGWGFIVLVYHPEFKVWTMYAHLQKLGVKRGQAVKAATLLGTIGKGADNQFKAHLHFEVRTSKLPAWYWPSTEFENRAEAEAFTRAHYTDGDAWLRSKGAVRSVADLRARTQAPRPAPTPAPRPPAPATPAAPVVPGVRVLLSDGQGNYENVAGKRVERLGIVVNATEPGEVWIRPG